MQIGFVGLGKMGAGIARNLLRAGHKVTVYNRTREKAEALEADGAHVADSAAAASKDCEAAITMLADDRAEESVVFGEDGLAAALPRGAAHISHSTISAAFARRLTSEHAKRGNVYISAPVFGRPEAAESQKLVVAVAGPAESVERYRALFDAIGRQTFVLSAEPWHANVVKLSGNFMIASMLETFGEAFALLRKAGIDPERFLEVMNALFGSPVYANYGKTVAEGKFKPAGFELKLGLKDVRLALECAEECGAPMPIASLVRDRLLAEMAHGGEHLDWSALTRAAARDAGL